MTFYDTAPVVILDMIEEYRLHMKVWDDAKHVVATEVRENLGDEGMVKLSDMDTVESQENMLYFVISEVLPPLASRWPRADRTEFELWTVNHVTQAVHEHNRKWVAAMSKRASPARFARDVHAKTKADDEYLQAIGARDDVRALQAFSVHLAPALGIMEGNTVAGVWWMSRVSDHLLHFVQEDMARDSLPDLEDETA